MKNKQDNPTVIAQAHPNRSQHSQIMTRQITKNCNKMRIYFQTPSILFHSIQTHAMSSMSVWKPRFEFKSQWTTVYVHFIHIYIQSRKAVLANGQSLPPTTKSYDQESKGIFKINTIEKRRGHKFVSLGR